jgi:hypothetical protein
VVPVLAPTYSDLGRMLEKIVKVTSAFQKEHLDET